jgi:hypothetical protein
MRFVYFDRRRAAIAMKASGFDAETGEMTGVIFHMLTSSRM